MVKVKQVAAGVQCGNKYGKWEVIGPPFASGGNDWRVVVRCDCGRIDAVSCTPLSQGKSSGCRHCTNAKSGTSHGGYYEQLYRVWSSMKSRCLNPAFKDFKNYGGRGISVCEEWTESYPCFRQWAMANGYADNLQIDRKDNNGNYEPSNCRFATRSTNCRNRRSNRIIEAFGESKCLAEWLEDPRCVCVWGTLKSRLDCGWEPERALTAPIRKWA